MKQTWMLISDFHTGATTGLSPSPSNPIQIEVLKRYEDALDWFGCRPDVVLHCGDAIDGKDRKGRDIDEGSMLQQADQAARLIAMARPKKEVILLTGTGYHCQIDDEDIEAHLLKCLEYQLRNTKCKVSWKDKLVTTINDWFVLQARHHISGSNIPHGRATAMLREQMWQNLNAMVDGKRNTHLQVFGHRHYSIEVKTPWGAAMVLPSWQAHGGKYGDRICTGHVDIGMVKLVIEDTEEKGWRSETKLYKAGVVNRLEHR